MSVVILEPKLRATSRVLSVEAPSTTINSMAGYLMDVRFSSVLLSAAGAFLTTVMIEIVGSAIFCELNGENSVLCNDKITKFVD